MGLPNYGVQHNYQHIIPLPNQLTPLDPFRASCEFATYPEFGFQETSDVEADSLLDMVLSDPYYAPILQDQPVSEFGEWSETIEGYSCHFEEPKMQIGEQEKQSENRKCSKNIRSKRVESDSKKLSRETISQHFYMPITEAAKAMKVGLTLLKKRCRELGIRRWPRRKLLSLQTLINHVQEMEGEEERREALKILEREKKLLEEIPDMELKGETKRLRQASFKSNYKKRRLMELEIEFTRKFCGNSMMEFEGDDGEELVSFCSDS